MRQGRLVVTDDPGGVRREIAVRSPAGVDHAVQKQQRRAVLVLFGIEGDDPAGAVVAVAGIGRLHRHRPAFHVRAGGDVQGVQPLEIRRAVFGHGHRVQDSVCAGGAVDHRRRGNADLRRDLAAAAVIAGGFARAEQRHFPELRAGIGVEGVGRIVFGHDEDDVVHAAGDAELGEVQRLGVHQAVHREVAQQAEGRRIHIGLRQGCFRSVLAGAQDIVVVGSDVSAGGSHDRIHCQRRRIAVDAGHGVGNDHAEGRAIVAGNGRRRGVAGRSRVRNVGVVLLPLIAEWRGSRGRHREGCGLPHGHGLVRRLRGDARRHRARADGQTRGVAGDGGHGVGDHHAEGRAIVTGNGRRRGVRGRSRAADVGIVFLPLIAERRGSRGHHRESRGLPHRHGLVRGLGGDARRHGRGIHGQRGGIAHRAASGVGGHHAEGRAVIAGNRGRRGVACRSRPADVAAVLLPLIGERSGSAHRHGEARRLPHGDRLVRRLRREGGQAGLRRILRHVGAGATPQRERQGQKRCNANQLFAVRAHSEIPIPRKPDSRRGRKIGRSLKTPWKHLAGTA